VVDRDGHVEGVVGISDLICHDAADSWEICRALKQIAAAEEVTAKAA